MDEHLNTPVIISSLPSASGKGVGRHGVWRASVLLLAGLIATGVAACYTKSEVDATGNREFAFPCSEIRAKILDRLSAHEQILRSGAAFYEGSDGVTRKEWYRFTERQKVEQQLPGVQGIGFALLIPGEKLAQHIQEGCDEGFPEYRVWPEGQRETYSSIIFLEPFADRNLRAFGYDMLSEPVRREAMERARDQDTAALSGRVVLVQETDKDVQSGTLMYVPVYRVGMPCKTVAERRAAILGWVYSPYRMNDLMQGILGGWDVEGNNRIHLEVFDGEKISPDTLLYDSRPDGGNELASTCALAFQTKIDTAGRRWTLNFIQSGSFAAAVDYGKVWLVLLGGTIVSLLLFGLSLALLNTQFNAWQIAQRLTAEYKRVDNALRQATDRLSLAARAGGGGIWDYDVVNSDLIWDDQMFHLYGITRDQFSGAYEAWRAGVHPEDQQRGDEEVLMALRGEKEFDTEFRIACQDGTVRHIHAVGLVQRNTAGQPVRMIGTNWDISERKRAEQALRESESNFRTFFASMTDMIFVGTSDGRVLFTNAAVTRTLGYLAEELAGMHLLDLHPTDCRREAEECFASMFRGERESCPLPLVARSGVLIPVETRCWPGKWNGEDCIFGVCKDLSAEQEAQQRFERLFRHNPALMALSVLPDRTFADVNDALLKTLGYSRDEIVGKTAGDLDLFVQAEQHAVVTNELQANGRVADFELQVRRKDGTILDGLFSGEVISSQGRQYFLTVMIDITAQKRAETELKKTVAALKSSNQSLAESSCRMEAATRAKSEFLANMSHEIRTPLTAILGYADLMLDENVGRAARGHVAIIQRNGEHLLGLINDILDLSKVEAGRLQIEPTRCSPVQLAAEVISLMRVRAEAKHLQLETEFVGRLPETVLTDPLRLRQVLVNLVGNSIKFTDQGTVRLAVRLTLDSGTARLRFDVTDTGIGMAQEQIGRLFQPFTQVDNSSARRFGGTGLGLCISKGMAEALGGGIEVHSSLGKGATFIVTIDPGPLDGIPMIENAQEALFNRSSVATAASSRKIVLRGRVLLAEDGLDNQRLISLLLRKAGAEVKAVENGQLAVESALAASEAGDPFDVILMDMQMPVMDGYTATRQLRDHGYTAPIVALTANAMAEDAKKCLDAGCDDYATKPVDRQRFLATVARWGARKHQGQGMH